MELDGNWVENTPRYLSKHGYTLEHPQNTPKTPMDTPKHPQAPQTRSNVSQEQLWLFPYSHQTVWEAFGLSRDVRKDSGRNEGVRWCLLSVRNVCKCLGMPLTMSRICQGWYGSVWVYLRVSWGCWRVKGGLRALSGSLFPFYFL